jgi:hypothetical protein
MHGIVLSAAPSLAGAGKSADAAASEINPPGGPPFALKLAPEWID